MRGKTVKSPEIVLNCVLWETDMLDTFFGLKADERFF